MSRKSKKAVIEEYIKRIIFLVEDIDDTYFFDDDNKKRLEGLLSKTFNIIGFEIKQSEEEQQGLYLILFKYVKKVEKDLIEHIVKHLKENGIDSSYKVQIIGVVESMSEKNSLHKILRERKKEIGKETSRKSSDVNVQVIFMPGFDSEPITLNVTRMNSLLFPEPNTNINVMASSKPVVEEIKGYLFVVKLSELVDIYNRVGDELFSSNLRFGIEDKMGLENAMKDTLIDEPNMFWFYNNGVTIVTDTKDIGLGNHNQVVLSEGRKSGTLPFSVVNGAQTITTASRIWGDDILPKEKITQSKEKAMVLVRVVIAQKLAAKRKITIALNRQKPIKSEDIAYQSSFITCFNEYMSSKAKEGGKYVYIIKRGETIYDDYAIELPLFAQLVYTCFMCPTEARNNGPTKLYYAEPNSNSERLNNTFFKESFTEAKSEKEQDEVFEKYYQPIFVALKIYRRYNAEFKKYTDKDSKTILGNNRWTFIALALMCMQGLTGNLDDVDYSNFEEKDEFCSNIRRYMDDFVKIVEDTYEGKYTPEDSKLKEFWIKIKSAEQKYSFSTLNAKVATNKSIEINDKDAFIANLITLGFEEESENSEYTFQLDSPIFSDVKVSIGSDKSFSISATLFDIYYDSDDETDDDDIKYAQLVEKVCDKLSFQLGEAPNIEEYFGCPDPSVDIEYYKKGFDSGFVNNFISLLEEMD